MEWLITGLLILPASLMTIYYCKGLKDLLNEGRNKEAKIIMEEMNIKALYEERKKLMNEYYDLLDEYHNGKDTSDMIDEVSEQIVMIEELIDLLESKDNKMEKRNED